MIEIPRLSLVILIGASGCGKSTFSRKHFLKTEVVSSDECRGLVSDDENDQAATKEAFELLNFTVRQRLKLGKLTVVDATNVQSAARKKLLDLALEFDVAAVAIVFNLDEEVCHARNALRPDRQFGKHVVAHQTRDLKKSISYLRREGFRYITVFDTVGAVDSAEVVRKPLFCDLQDEHGPFDIIGDIHGCEMELRKLLDVLGYAETEGCFSHAEGRKVLYVGDLVDRGPSSPGVLKIVMAMVAAGSGYCVIGNHDNRLLRKLRGEPVSITHGLDLTLAQFEAEPPFFRDAVVKFVDSLPSHYVVDGGKLVIAHAGMKESLQGRTSRRVRDFGMYGETTGEIDEFGLPVRYQWAADYRGAAMVAYGHTPVVNTEWLNKTICLDTGCVFGGKLTALQYPEMTTVEVPAAEEYCTPVRPIGYGAGERSSQQEADDLLDIADVQGRQHIRCEMGGTVMIPEENGIAALEILSRYSTNPKWLVYLPPTMSPCETSSRPDFLEHPDEAFAYFKKVGQNSVICEEKHMGSRAVVIVGKTEDVIKSRFGVTARSLGAIYTRTGRKFFNNPSLEQEFLAKVRDGMSSASFWDDLETDWAVMDCELMPWSAKAQQLILDQYVPVGVAAHHQLAAMAHWTDAARALNLDQIQSLGDRTKRRLTEAELYREAYKHYCWPVESLADYKLAPFHIMATEGQVHIDKNHLWHMEKIGTLSTCDPETFRKTQTLVVDLNDEASVQSGVEWWMKLTDSGGEGMVVKPIDFAPVGERGLIQPALKCRGRDYLRIIYGPEYLISENLEKLRSRAVGHKRRLAIREFICGIEGLRRFVANEPLRRVHQCAFGVLALESEPVDPTL